ERSEGTPTDINGQAMYYYEQEKFDEAIALFSQGQSNDQAYQFYLCVSYLGNQQPSQAEHTLASLTEDQESAFYEAALWYTGLANLANDEPEKAKSKLEMVSRMEGEFSSEAQELLEKL
ncbi:MAG: hypothetical protein AAF992_21900, partial [Bacteroidota bacterium]